MVTGLSAEGVKKEFLEHAVEAQQHADRIAERIVELNGKPNFNPEGLTERSLSQYTSAITIHEMIRWAASSTASVKHDYRFSLA
jgi:bacterioferritin